MIQNRLSVVVEVGESKLLMERRVAGFFRYPGGKSKLRKRIASKIHDIIDGSNVEYREPFFGGGSIGLLLMRDNPNLRDVWINDLDLGVSALWTAVMRRPGELIDCVQEFVPSVEAFDEYKSKLLDPQKWYWDIDDCAEFGFMKLAIHQISYSGLGTKSGGPLGGRDQKSAYKIDCRWSPDYICKKIVDINKMFSGMNVRNEKCTCRDFCDVITDCEKPAVIYLDPPYYDKGNDLYQHGLSILDHQRLADCLRTTNHRWLLSYDNCEEVRDLYSWANMEVIEEVSYSITATKDKETGGRASRVKSELLITPRQYVHG